MVYSNTNVLVNVGENLMIQFLSPGPKKDNSIFDITVNIVGEEIYVNGSSVHPKDAEIQKALLDAGWEIGVLENRYVVYYFSPNNVCPKKLKHVSEQIKEAYLQDLL
jgi:hypothetical protein